MDWQALIAEVLSAGELTQTEVADRLSKSCGKRVSQSTVSDLFTGNNTNPGWALGEAIKALRNAVVAAAKAKSGGKRLTESAHPQGAARRVSRRDGPSVELERN